MYQSSDLGGVMGMMPAFTTDDGGDINATNTVDTDRLAAGVDRMIGDGIDVISTTGSFGEFHTLLDEEFDTLVRATIDVVNKRVPLFIGCTALNSREAVRKMTVARDAGAEGVLMGVPFYFPSTVGNAIRFYHDIGELFPTLSIMIYHNPTLHNVTLPVAAFKEITKNANVVAMKDSHRSTTEFIQLQEVIRGHISVFVNQTQYHPFADLGAPGFWSIDAWMGPWPLLYLRDAVARGDIDAAIRVTMDLAGMTTGPKNLSWRETGSKLSCKFAGYVDPGPLRPPFVEVPDEVIAQQKAKAKRWGELCDKYRTPVPAAVSA